MSIGPQTLCFACKRFRPDFEKGPTCTAFPDGIPERIVKGGYDHRKSFPGDGGTRFVRDPDKPLPPGYPEEQAEVEPVVISDPGVIRHQTKKELRETARKMISEFRNHPGRPN